MILLEDIKMVHIEASSRCNSHCPMCSRYTADGFLQPHLIEGDLTRESFYKLFTENFVDQLDHVYFSGVYGDPCLNKLLPEFVDYLLDKGCKSISIDTNGGYRNEEWWASLAKPNVMINFALDGTDNETLAKYRMGVIYDKVIKNLKAYVAAGGVAQWNFIVFEHNEYQIETAKELAKEIGAEFRIKVTQKFRQKKEFKVIKDGKHVFTLLPPNSSQYRHSNVGTKEHQPISVFKYDLAKFSSFNNNKIKCKSVERREIFLAANGMVFPCCYLGTYTHDSPGSYQFNTLYNVSDFNLNTNSISQILEKFSSISSKWDTTIENGNLLTCLATCGNEENTTLYYTKDLNKENILKIKK
jgi:MoaA/NifB/PqqE/SkfB family radical SAM enzyme